MIISFLWNPSGWKPALIVCDRNNYNNKTEGAGRGPGDGRGPGWEENRRGAETSGQGPGAWMLGRSSLPHLCRPSHFTTALNLYVPDRRAPGLGGIRPGRPGGGDA